MLIACEQDETISQHETAGVKPFASLLRRDSFGQLVVIRTGSIYVTPGSDRRSTGTHYTPRSLTEPIVKYTACPHHCWTTNIIGALGNPAAHTLRHWKNGAALVGRGLRGDGEELSYEQC